jgi:hypothetical protein
VATFTATVDLNMRWFGNDLVGQAGDTYRIADALYDEFNAAFGTTGLIPGLSWIVIDESTTDVVGGVTVSGVAASRRVIVASSSVAAAWQSSATVFAKVYATSTQSVPHDVATTMNFDTVESDIHGFWSSTQPTRLTVPSGFGGVPFIVQAGTFTELDPVQDVILYVRSNVDTGGIRGTQQSFPQTGSNNNPIGYIATPPVPVLLNAGDYIEFIVYVDSLTGDKTFGTAGGGSPTWMAITRLG